MRIRRNRGTECFFYLECGGILFDIGIALRTDTVHIRDKIQIFYARHKFVYIGIVRNICHELFTLHRMLLYRHSVYSDFALGKAEYTCGGFQRGGFARAVMTDKAVNIACLHCKRKVVYRFLPAFIGFGKIDE